jgi:hypothetical protein
MYDPQHLYQATHVCTPAHLPACCIHVCSFLACPCVPRYIANEFAGIFRGVGADVHLMYRGDLPLRGFDQECRAQVAENLASRGVQVRTQQQQQQQQPCVVFTSWLFCHVYRCRCNNGRHVTWHKELCVLRFLLACNT